MAAIAAKLGITADGEASASVMANTVNPTQATVDGYYALYWNLVGTLLPNGTVTGDLYAAGSTFSIDPASAAYKIYAPLAQQYENQTARANGVAAVTVTQNQVETYVNGLYQTIVTLYAPAFAEFYGAGWLSQPAFVTKSSAPTIFSSAAVSALEVNSSQSAAALLNSAVSYNALQPAGSAVVGIGMPNVIGQSVTITQSEAVGRLGVPIEIPFASILAGSLTTPQSEALELATSPGQATFEVQTASGASISIPITELSLNNGQYYYTPKGGAAAPVTVTNVSIQEPAPLFVAVNGSLDVTSQGSVYAQSTIPDLPVGAIHAHGAVSLSAPQSITSALATGVANIVTSNGGISLASETGSIGSLNLPLTMMVTDAPATGALTSVSAGSDAYLNFIGGDLTVGSVFANGTASISSQYGIFSADAAVNVTAHDIVLTAQRDIGASTAPLQVQVGAGGALSGSAGGAAYIYGPTESNQAPVTLAVSDFTSARDMDLTADGPISASDVTATNGVMTVASGSDVTLTDATSFGAMTVTAAGNMTVGSLTTTSIHGVIDLTAGANGAVTVDAGAAVVSAASVTTQSDSVDMEAGSTVTAQGPVSISTTGDAVLGAVDAQSGTLDVTSDGETGRILSNGDATAALTADGAGGSIALMAGGDIGAPLLPINVATPILSAASSHGGIWIAGQGDLDATSLSAPEGALVASATGKLTVGTAAAGLTLTLVGDTGLTAGTVTSGGDASLTALAGALDLTGSLASQGAAVFNAQDGDAILPSVTAGTFLTADASGALTLGTLSSGGAMTLSGGKDVTFNSLATTIDGDIAVTSTSGNIAGASQGTITSAGAAALTASAGDVTLASIDAATTISVTAGQTASIMTLASYGSETLTAGALDLGTITTTGTASDPGNVTLAAGSGGVVAGAITLAGTAEITSQGAVALTDVTAGGSITATALGAVAFDALTATGTDGDPGDVGVTAGGTISGQDIAAHRNIALTSTGGAIDVAQLVAATGSALASGAGDVTLPSVTAAGAFTASSGAMLTLVDATSGGTQTLSAAGAIQFAKLQANGTDADPGDIGLTAGGAISGQDIAAHRNIALTSTGGAIDVAELVAATGSALASGAGNVTLPSVTAARAFTASSGGTLTLGNATSGGTQTLYAGDEVKFVQLTTTGLSDDPGDVDITAVSGPILGGNINAAGSVRLNGYGVRFGTILAGDDGSIISGAGISGDRVSVGNNLFVQSGPGDIALGEASGRTLDLEAGGAISIAELVVRDSLTMRARVINGAIDQAPGTTNPLVLDVTGPHGALAQEVDLHVGAPNGLVLPQFSAIDATLITTADQVVGQFDVTGRMLLETAEASVLLDNADPQPEKGIDVQLYQPGGQFFFAQNGTVSDTDAYVVAYQQAFQVFDAAFTDDHTDSFPEFDGSSVVRDAVWNTAQDMRDAEAAASTDDFSLKLLLQRLRLHIPLVTVKPGLSGPAVNLNSASNGH